MSPSSSDASSSRAPRGTSPWAPTVPSSPPLAAPIANSEPSDQDNAKKSAWGTAAAAAAGSSSNGEIELGPVMGADSWPALGESTAKSVPKSSSPPSDLANISAPQISSTGSSNNVGGAVSSPMPLASGEMVSPEKKESLPRSNGGNWDHGYSSRGGTNGFLPQHHGGSHHHRHRPFYRRGNNNSSHRGNGWHNAPHHPRHMGLPAPHDFFGKQPPVPPMGPALFFRVRPFEGPPIGFSAEIPSHLYYVPPPTPFVTPNVAAYLLARAMPPPIVDSAAEQREAVAKQIEYYFSNDNLVKDTYLRKQMDDQGWVPVSLIAGFSKVKTITLNIPNNKKFILDSIRTLKLVEVQGEKIRRRGDWMKWMMNSQPIQNGRPSGPYPQAMPNTDNIIDHIQGVVLEEETSDRSASGNRTSQKQVGDSKNTATTQ